MCLAYAPRRVLCEHCGGVHEGDALGVGQTPIHTYAVGNAGELSTGSDLEGGGQAVLLLLEHGGGGG